MERRLFIVSNRLPINIDASAANDVIKPSSGGLVTAISSYLDKQEQTGSLMFDNQFWVGIPGCTSGTWNNISAKIEPDGYEYLPVFVNKKTYDGYYNGMSNSVLWSLFHYFPSFAEFNTDNYRHYKEVNQAFADVLLKYLQPGDVVWIHDYHLLPLSALIREKMPEVTIGLFLHIPFPSYEIFRIIPKRWQQEILEGMLGADLVGFHTLDYALHFLKSLQMIKGIEHDMYMLRHKSRLIKVGVFPISIDFNKYNNAYDHHEVKRQRDLTRKQFKDKKVIFSADRLDYTKGVYNRLRSYEYFLKHNPDYHEKVVFVMVIVPSRDLISKYAERKRMIDEYIGNLNSRIGNFRWQPIIYQYNTLEFHELIAMYTSCDVALITPIRDGMNLVAKEFVASRRDYKGVLVLSEMTGAAKELTEALTISPSDIEEIAEKIKLGLEMPVMEQSNRMASMQEKIKSYDVIAWAADFFENLFQIKHIKQYYEVKFLDTVCKAHLMASYEDSGKRLLLLDYDGTLTSLAPLPHLAKPDDHLRDVLRNLVCDKRNTVYIVSGRDSYTLHEWLGDLDVNIIAEHGALSKVNGCDWIVSPHINKAWIKQVNSIMEKYIKNCSGSFVENKLYSVAWHYRGADPEHSNRYASELYNELQSCSAKMNISIVKGNKVIEVRNKGINKGQAIRQVIAKDTYDFIFACGDDTTDEDMFYELSDMKHAFTIKIGEQASYAKYNLHNSSMVLSLLDTFGSIRAAYQK